VMTPEREARIEAGRLRRMQESELYPSWCVRHGHRLKWIPAPGWWIHAHNSETCIPMRGKKAPEDRL
jgi:hypothetical protein